MLLTSDVQKSITVSVLCWFATTDCDGVPNVSPKEIFAYYKNDTIIIANIASPQTMKNLKTNSAACISFIDILVQKGFQVKGTAQIIEKDNPAFAPMEDVLLQMTDGKFPFSSIIALEALTVKPIIAPMYILYPETTEEQQITAAKKAYGL